MRKKMRLIDADKYCDFLNIYPLEKAHNNFMSFYREALQKTYEFEVKAIPIEWLMKKADEWVTKDITYDGKPFTAQQVGLAIASMVIDWEKENDKDSE